MTECTQGSPEWFAARCGKLTASRFAEAVARTRSGWGASRKNLMAQLAAERLTGVVAESYASAAMQWGNEIKPESGVAYEFYHDARVKAVGFIDHPQIAMTGASPDGLVLPGANAYNHHVNPIPERVRMFMDDLTMTYWFVANARRFVVVLKISTVFEAMYAGLFLPYTTPVSWPYPLFIGGSAGQGAQNPGTPWRTPIRTLSIPMQNMGVMF